MITILEEIQAIYPEPIILEEQEESFTNSFHARYTTKYVDLELPTPLLDANNIEIIYIKDDYGQQGDWHNNIIGKLKNGTYFFHSESGDYTFSGTSIIFSPEIEDFFYFALSEEEQKKYIELMPLVEKVQLERDISSSTTIATNKIKL